MSRELKFMGYVKKLKKLLPVYEINLSSIDEHPILIADCGDVDCGLCVDMYKSEEVELLQYTGLKDKNGVEIYEGFIFRAPHDFGPAGYHTRLGIVSYDATDGYDWNYWLLEELEVIGNIYDNPELLEESSNE